MLVLNEKQKSHIANVITAKRKEFYDYPGGTRDLAARIGVSPQLVSMWAHSKRVPGHKELLILSEVFEMDFNELCCLNKATKSSASVLKRCGSFPATPSQINKSMLAICNITGEIVKRQRQMLKGKRDIKKHSEWLKRIQCYADTISFRL